MKHGGIVGLATLAIVSFLQFANGQGTTFVYDQQSGDENAFIGAASAIQSNQPMGQSFTPSLTAAGFLRLSVNDATPGNGIGASLYVNLRSTSISGPILGATAPVALPHNFGQRSKRSVNFFFSAPVPVTPGPVRY